MKPFKTPYGNIHLAPERYEEFLAIVSKHTTALILELKKHKIAPVVVALEKTDIYELDELKKMDELRQLNNKES
jgi:hypothetical protein